MCFTSVCLIFSDFIAFSVRLKLDFDFAMCFDQPHGILLPLFAKPFE